MGSARTRALGPRFTRQDNRRLPFLSGAKVGLVRHPGLCFSGAILCVLFLFALNLALGSLLLVQVDRFDDSGPGQRI